jgi:multicomponent K+:H+ antiporter subunit D
VSHLIILPIVMPLLAGTCLLLGSHLSAGLRRSIGFVATLVLLPVAVLLLARVADGAHLVYALGAWPPPFAIVLVADRLTALMLLVTSIVALAGILYSSGGDDAAGPQFHALFQFQLMGINGAFLTGDLFNLFVFFEVLLISFYALLLHGLGAQRVSASIHVVVLNLIGSALFLFAVGTLYGVTGTLNLADLSRVLPTLGPDEAALARSGALLLLGVFALKAALLPFGFWLPRAYGAAAAAASALFAVLTKVGVYAILRIYALAFGPEAGAVASVATPWVLPAALVTLAFGALGTLGAQGLREAAGWLVLYSVGTLLVAVGLFTEAGYAAAVYYTAHSTLAGAALFLVADVVSRSRAAAGDRLDVPDVMPRMALTGSLFLLVAIAVSGLPPLSGFPGKVMVLTAAQAAEPAPWIWSILLGSTLLVVVALSRAGSALFWRTNEGAHGMPATALPRRAFFAVGGLLACVVGLVIWGGPVTEYSKATAHQLTNPSGYRWAVLGGPDDEVPDDRRSVR